MQQPCRRTDLDAESYDQVRQFLEQLRLRNLSPATLTARRGALKKFTSFMLEHGVHTFREIDARAVEAFRLHLGRNGFSMHSMENYLAAVRQFFGFLERRALIFDNPTADMVVRRSRPPLPKVLNVEQVRALLSAPDPTTVRGRRDRALLEVLYATGMRRAELLGLTVFDVQLKERTVRVFGKGRKQRMLPLGRHAAGALSAYIADSRPAMIDHAKPPLDALWVRYRHTRLHNSALANIIDRMRRRAGIDEPVSSHTLRRTCATHMLQNGADPFTVAMLLGHADLKTLCHYLRLTITDIKAMHRNSKVGQ